MKYIYFAIATTGLDEIYDDIIKLSLLIEEEGNVLVKRCYNIKPRKGTKPSQLNQQTLDFNGVTIEQLREFRDPKETSDRLAEVLKEYSNNGIDKLIVVGHNNKFDSCFIDRFLARYQGYFRSKYLVTSYDVDIMKVAPFVEFHTGIKFKDYKLRTLTNYFNLEYDTTDINTKLNCIREINRMFKDLDKIKMLGKLEK